MKAKWYPQFPTVIILFLIALLIVGSFPKAMAQAPATTQPNRIDSDGDGYLDGPDTWIDMSASGLWLRCGEDKNGNGKYEPLGTDGIAGTEDDEYDPNNPSSHPPNNPNKADYVPKILATDSDKDGLSDADEDAIGTNPYDADSDDDGICDGDEVHGAMPCAAGWAVRKLSPLCPDTDGDGLPDGLEMGLTQWDNLSSAENPGKNHYNEKWYGDINRSAQYTAVLWNKDPNSPPTFNQYCFMPVNGTASITDAYSFDTDHDGVCDSDEDLDRDGLLDSPESGETDPSRGLVNLPDTEDRNIEDPSWVTFSGDGDLLLGLDLHEGIAAPTITSGFGVSLGSSTGEISLGISGSTAITLSDSTIGTSDLDSDLKCAAVNLSTATSGYIPFTLNFSTAPGSSRTINPAMTPQARDSFEDIFYDDPDVDIYVIDQLGEELEQYIKDTTVGELVGLLASWGIDMLPGGRIVKMSIGAISLEIQFFTSTLPKALSYYVDLIQTMHNMGLRVLEEMLPLSGAIVGALGTGVEEETYPAIMQAVTLLYIRENLTNKDGFGQPKTWYIQHKFHTGLSGITQYGQTLTYRFSDNALAEIETMEMLKKGLLDGIPPLEHAYLLHYRGNQGIDILGSDKDCNVYSIEDKNGQGTLKKRAKDIYPGDLRFTLTRIYGFILHGKYAYGTDGLFVLDTVEEKLAFLKTHIAPRNEGWKILIDHLYSYIDESGDRNLVHLDVFADHIAEKESNNADMIQRVANTIALLRSVVVNNPERIRTLAERLPAHYYTASGNLVAHRGAIIAELGEKVGEEVVAEAAKEAATAVLETTTKRALRTKIRTISAELLLRLRR